METQALFNVPDGATQDGVDEMNGRFYSRFNFPWVPVALPYYADAGFWTAALNQDLGCWQTPRFKGPLKIWVAGCGTNQAVFTALKFPQAEIIGSDVSWRSLEVCERTAKQVGVTNLTLRRESLNEVSYSEQFDYIISTGVIHHNADPATTLNNIVRALKPDGVIELMVYNYYHRILTTAFQKAIRLLGGETSKPNIDRELALTQSLLKQFPIDNLMKDFLSSQLDVPEASLADSLLQPVEYSYTVETLNSLVQGAGLEMLVHCIRQWDRNNISWNMQFSDKIMRESYDALDDLPRWQVSNLLMGEQSPFLWFYLQKQGCAYPRTGEKELCERFLDTVFVRHQTLSGNFVLCEDRFERESANRLIPNPERPVEAIARAVYDRVDGTHSMRDICRRLGINPADFHKVNRIRLLLATSGFPYLCSRELVAACAQPAAEVAATGS